jgi:hypothetical protein
VPEYWRCTPTLCWPFLEKPGFIDNEYALGIAEMLDHLGAQIVSDFIGLPSGAAQ